MAVADARAELNEAADAKESSTAAVHATRSTTGGPPIGAVNVDDRLPHSDAVIFKCFRSLKPASGAERCTSAVGVLFMSGCMHPVSLVRYVLNGTSLRVDTSG